MNLFESWSTRLLTVEQSASRRQNSDTRPNEGLSRFEFLLSEFVRKKEDLSRERLLALVEDKKKKVGGGYLNDQGALFLVAADLGVTLTYNVKALLKLNELNIDQKEVNSVARILSTGPPKKYTRENDSAIAFRARLIIYDETATSSVTLWDNKATLIATDPIFSPGNAIKISNAYVKEGLNGLPVINAGEQTTFELVGEGDANARLIPRLDQLVNSPESISGEKNGLIVAGRISSEIKRNDFQRKDGTQSFLYTFTLTSEKSTSQIRVVIWENHSPVFQKSSRDENVTFLNLRSRKGGIADTNLLELHGDETSIILERWRETQEWYRKSVTDILGSNSPSESVSGSLIRKNSVGSLPFVARIFCIALAVGGESAHALIIDSSRRKIVLNLLGDALSNARELQEDDVVICKPDSFDQVNLRATCSKKGSVFKVKSRREDIPKSSSLLSRIDKLESGNLVSVEVMTLTSSILKEIPTKEGIVKRAELSVADPTGEIKVYSWRNLARHLEKIPAGTKLSLKGLEVQTYEGRKFLLVKNYSEIRIN